MLNQHLVVERCSVGCSNSRPEDSWLGTKSVIALSAQCPTKDTRPEFR